MPVMELLQIFYVIDNEQMVKVKHLLNELLKGKKSFLTKDKQTIEYFL
jgi:hypothetical protein